MSKVVAKAFQVALDVLALSVVFIIAFGLRFDWRIPPTFIHRCVILLPMVVAFKYAVMMRFDIHRFAWRYIGLREVVRILQALATASSVLLLMRVAAIPLSRRYRFLDNIWIPIGIIVIDFVLAFSAIVGLRAVRRVTAEQRTRKVNRVSTQAVPTLLVGAGQAGVIVARNLEAHPSLGMRPVGFIDDNPIKVGTMVHGVPVLGSTAELPDLIAATGAGQVLITFAGGSGKEIRRIVDLCAKAEVRVKTIPGIQEIVGGHVNLTRVRDIAIEDLLRRDPVSLDEADIQRTMAGGSVLVTGAGGSIGSELCRQICRFEPKELLIVEQAENALFEIHRELTRAFPLVRLVPIIADITDSERMRAVFKLHRPDVVLHAAAHKHVPMMEWNPGEAIKNNVFGTKCLADLADEFTAKYFVMISTDKAVNPTSVMGASKRVAELVVQSLSKRSETRFVAVRFGNVLGSQGSVIPIFKQQIAAGGPVMVTHPEMRRYFMTIPEAAQLVLQAGAMGEGGEIFILDMGEPIKIVDLATDLIRLSGLRPSDDVEIQFSGLRPGEKLFEELSVAAENADKTRHPKIFVGRLGGVDEHKLAEALKLLRHDADREPSRIRARLQQIVPEYTPDHGAPAEPPPAPVSFRSLAEVR